MFYTRSGIAYKQCRPPSSADGSRTVEQWITKVVIKIWIYGRYHNLGYVSICTTREVKWIFFAKNNFIITAWGLVTPTGVTIDTSISRSRINNHQYQIPVTIHLVYFKILYSSLPFTLTITIYYYLLTCLLRNIMYLHHVVILITRAFHSLWWIVNDIGYFPISTT